MDFPYTCPHCKQTFLATEEHVGAEIDCPGCARKSTVRKDPPSTAGSPDKEVLNLSLEKLAVPREKTYFTILLSVSIIGWIALTVSIVGIVYALLFALAAWFASGLLAARLRSESIRVTAEQFPVLHRSFEEVCRKLKLEKIPEFHIMQHNGVLNAFAMRHSGRNFVVIFSDLLEALGHDSPQIRFLIGHEIGHISRNHLLKRLALVPSMIIPLIGHAYHRACEATCDRFGLFAAGETRGATQGLLVLAAGREAAPMADPVAFARQHHQQRGFFVSWHELASGYPTLSQRVSNMLSVGNPEFRKKAGRSPLAYLFAPIFSFQTLVIIYLVAVFGAMALPAIHKAFDRGRGAPPRSKAIPQVLPKKTAYPSKRVP